MTFYYLKSGYVQCLYYELLQQDSGFYKNETAYAQYAQCSAQNKFIDFRNLSGR